MGEGGVRGRDAGFDWSRLEKITGFVAAVKLPRTKAEICNMEQDIENIKVDIKVNLRRLFPIFLELLGPNKLDWTTINRVVKNKYTGHRALYAARTTPLRVQISIYTLIARAIDKEPSALRLLDYLQKLFEELCDRLDDREKREITDNLFGVLTNVDLKFLNFIGELSVLNCYKTNYPCTLLRSEEPLIPGKPNGSKIDFKIHNLQTNHIHRIEVVNVHLSKNHLASDSTIARLLEQKINSKLLRTGILESPDFFLVPVFWGQWDEITTVINYYEREKPVFRQTANPTCFATFTDQAGNRVHKFGEMVGMKRDVVE